MRSPASTRRDTVPELGTSIGDALLVPHRSYLPVVGPLLGSGWIKGMAHITGGGVTDNLPRILPEGMHAAVFRGSWQVPPIFGWLQATGEVPEEDMYRAFNMGIGLIVVCAAEHAEPLLGTLAEGGEAGALRIGEVREGGDGVRYVAG